MTIVVRRAEPAEADALAPVLTALCRRSKAHWGYPPELLVRWADDLRIEPADIIRDQVLVATDSDAADGDAAIAGFARVVERADHAQLADLWVEPTSMGTGVGRSLWSAAVNVARTLPSDELRFAADPNAEPFYERMGARRIGDLPSEVVQGRTLGLMAYDLATAPGA
jgi:GNAT superfamily N-acetyltransferase